MNIGLRDCFEPKNNNLPRYFYFLPTIGYSYSAESNEIMYFIAIWNLLFGISHKDIYYNKSHFFIIFPTLSYQKIYSSYKIQLTWLFWYIDIIKKG